MLISTLPVSVQLVCRKVLKIKQVCNVLKHLAMLQATSQDTETLVLDPSVRAAGENTFCKELASMQHC